MFQFVGKPGPPPRPMETTPIYTPPPFRVPLPPHQRCPPWPWRGVTKASPGFEFGTTTAEFLDDFRYDEFWFGMNFCHQFEIWSPNSRFPILGGGRKYLFGKSFPLTAWPVMDSRSFWRLEDMGCTFLVIPNSEQKCNLFRVPCLFSVPFGFWYFVP